MSKKDKLKDIGLYFITDRILTKKNIFEDVKSAIKGGVKIVQYREKDLPTKNIIEEATKIKEICINNNVLFLINDFVDIALKVGADGVHLGSGDMPYKKARELLGKGKIIGLTAHNMEEAVEFEKSGADYLGVSPVFHTSTKEDAGKAMGIEKLKEVINTVNIPCIAIGGINENNMEKVVKTGVDGISMISAIITKDNVEETVKNLIDKIRKEKLIKPSK